MHDKQLTIQNKCNFDNYSNDVERIRIVNQFDIFKN